MEFLDRIEAARLILFAVGIWFGVSLERARWRRGARSDRAFGVGSRLYFAQEITKKMVDEVEKTET